MTAERSSEDNDGDQVRATIALAGGCALQRGSVTHMIQFLEPGSEDVDPCDRGWLYRRAPGFIRHQRSRNPQPARKIGLLGIVHAGIPRANASATTQMRSGS